MRRPGRTTVVVGAAAAALAGLAACSSGGSSTGPSAVSATGTAVSGDSGPPTASTQAEPAASGSRQAWTRGTTATFTNNTGAVVQIGAGGYGDDAPDIPQSPLPSGSAVSANDPSGYGGSSLFARITYPDGKVAEVLLVNPVIVTPYAEWRQGRVTTSWDLFHGESESLDENESTSATIAGHAITFARLADDSDNKNWAVTLDS